MTEEMLIDLESSEGALRPYHTIELFEWVKTTIIVCSTRAIYGTANPFNHGVTERVSDFWYYLIPH